MRNTQMGEPSERANVVSMLHVTTLRITRASRLERRVATRASPRTGTGPRPAARGSGPARRGCGRVSRERFTALVCPLAESRAQRVRELLRSLRGAL